MERRVSVCRCCGKAFETEIESYKSDEFLPHYCQKPECQDAKKESKRWKKYYNKEKRRERAEKKTFVLKCLECGREFEWNGWSERDITKPTCCSKECSVSRRRKHDFIYNRTAKKGKRRIDTSKMTGAELNALVEKLKAEPLEKFKAVCEHCGREFEYDACHSGFGHKRKYCSEDCRVKGTLARVAMERNEKSSHEVTCSVCGKKFWSIHPTAKYCGKACKYKGSHPELFFNPDGSLKVKQAIEKECEHCHSKFVTERKDKKFCSDRCRKNHYKRQSAAGHSVYEKECSFCGKKFETEFKNKRFCSGDCRKKFFISSKNPVEKIAVKRVCRQCGREFEFETYSGSSEKFWPKTCSKECREAWNAAHPESKKWVRGGGQKKEPKVFKCERCGKEFSTTRYNGPNAQRFCSKECRFAAIYQRNLIARRKPKVAVKCAVCGKEITISEGSNKKYCSKECKRAAERRNKNYVISDPIEKTCRHCGKAFSTRNHIRLYCSKECKEEYKKLHPESRNYVKKAFEPKVCVICGKTFVPKSKTQKTCGDPECKRLLNLRRPRGMRNRTYGQVPNAKPRLCGWCGQEFVPPKNHPRAKCCSGACRRHYKRNEHKSEVQVAFENAALLKTNWKPGLSVLLSTRKCRHCGKDFVPESKGQRYCSAECKKAVQPKAYVPVEKALKTCIVCGKDFYGYSHQKCCSRECSKKHQSSWVLFHSCGSAARQRRTVKTVCMECGQEFEYELIGRKRHRKFCSEACSKNYWQRYSRDLLSSMRADPGYIEKKRLEKEAKSAMAEILKEEKRKAAKELKEKFRAMRALAAEEKVAARAAIKAEIAKCRELERAEKRLAIEEARAAKKIEREKERFERIKKRREERDARILANREKRRLVKEEARRLKAERLEEMRLHPERALDIAKARNERVLALRMQRAAEQRAKARAEQRAKKQVWIEAARAQGKTIANAVCRHCGEEFEYVIVNLNTTGCKNKGVPEKPQFCCQSCRDRWKWEHGGRDKARKKHEQEKAQGGQWIGTHWVVPKKQETLTTTWRSSGKTYSTGLSAVNDPYADLEFEGAMTGDWSSEDSQAKAFLAD